MPRGNQRLQLRKERTGARASNQQTAPFAVPSASTFDFNIPPHPNAQPDTSTMAGTSSSVPWADINALFADLPGMGITITPDAAHQASEDTHTESFEEMLAAGGVDFLGAQADPCGAPQVLDAPYPNMEVDSGSMQPVAPPELYIDPALLTLSPKPTATVRREAATPADDQDASDIQPTITLREQLEEANEKVDDLNDAICVLQIRLDKYEGPNTSDVVTAFQERITEMSDEARQREMEVAGLQDLTKQQQERIKTLEGKVASYASEEETIKSQIDSYKSAAKASDKRLEDLNKRHEETTKTLEGQVASYKSQEETIKSQKEQIDGYKSAAKASDTRLQDLTKQQEETIKTLEGKLANYASAEETIKSQKQQIDSYKSAAKAGDKGLQQQQEKIKTLEAKVASYAPVEETIKSQKDLIERYKVGETMGNQTLNKYRQRIHDQQAALKEQETAADDLRNKNEQYQMALQQRSSNYNELQATLDQQHVTLESKDEQIKSQEERIRQLTGEVKQHLASITMADDEITRLNKAAKEREEREGSHRDQRRVLKAKAESLEVELESTTGELEATRTEIKALKVESREKGYAIQRLEEGQGSYVKVYNETLTLQDTLRTQDEDMEALKGDLQDLEEEIGRLRRERRRGSSQSESRGEGERERVPGVGGYTTLEGVLGEEEEDEDNLQGGEPAGPAEGTGTGAEVDGGMEGDEREEEVGGEVEVDGEKEVTRPASVEPAERIVEVPTMVYCPWLWWKMPYQALLLLLFVGGLPSVSAVFWKFVGCHLFAVNWPLVQFLGRRVDVTPHSPRPRHLPPPAKVVMLLAWHLVVYASIGALLWHLSGAMGERTMWLRANQLSRATLIGLRESLRQSPNVGNPVVRFTLRLAPKVAAFERVAGRWLPGNRGVFG